MKVRRPPRWLERTAQRALPPGLSGQSTLGDLAEEFDQRAASSAVRAMMWYTGQVASIVAYRGLTGTGARGSSAESDIGQDFRWSFRSLLRNPGFAIGVVAILGLGLGANTAVFSVVDGTLRHSTTWKDPEATTAIWPGMLFSFGQIELYEEEQGAYRTVGGYVESAFALRRLDGESESANGVRITPALFGELSAQPTLGRGLVDEDAFFGSQPVVVLGQSLWRRSFGSDPNIVGQRVDIGGRPVTVVGVQRAEARAPGGRAELWFPLVMDPRDEDYWRSQNLTTIGVLREGADLAEGMTDLMAFTERLTRIFPQFFPPGFADGSASVERADTTQRRSISTPLRLLLGGTALLMLITTLNVGNLLLSRAIDRRKELSVRASLGAGRGRIVRQLLVEGFVLTVLALAVGLALGSYGGRWISNLFVDAAVVTASPIFSGSVLVFSVSISALAWVVLNGVPIAHFLRTHQGKLDIAPQSKSTLLRGLVTIQAALATLLLVSATLLVVTVQNLRNVPLGFEADNLTTIAMSIPEDRMESLPLARELYDRLSGSIDRLNGVEAVGLTGWLPLRTNAPVTVVNLEVAPVDPAQALQVPMQMVDPGFFAALGVEPIAGRLLDSQDREPSPSAIVVNQTLARMLWPDQHAVGQRIAVDPHEWTTWAPVVGIIPDIRSGEITAPVGPVLYVSLAESPARDLTLVVRSQIRSAELVPLLRQALTDAAPLVPIRDVTPMTRVVRTAYSTSWVTTGLLIVLAVFATGLGALGIYAVLAHYVASNKRAIAVRMALGARPSVVVGGLVKSGVLLAFIGIGIGSLAAAISTRFLESLLFEVSALAPLAFLAPAVGLLAVAALAAWIPARRASRLPPAHVLRSE